MTFSQRFDKIVYFDQLLVPFDQISRLDNEYILQVHKYSVLCMKYLFSSMSFIYTKFIHL